MNRRGTLALHQGYVNDSAWDFRDEFGSAGLADAPRRDPRLRFGFCNIRGVFGSRTCRCLIEHDRQFHPDGARPHGRAHDEGGRQQSQPPQFSE